MKSLLKKVFIGIPLALTLFIIIYISLWYVLAFSGSWLVIVPVGVILLVGYVLLQLIDVLIG